MSQRPQPVQHEQSYVDGLYARLDELRALAGNRLTSVRAARPTGTHQSRSERDAFADLHETRLAQLRAVEDRLCFGRLDLVDGRRHYIGRMGLSDEEQTQLLLDWRAPAAERFYQATAARPDGVVRRRHLVTSERRVTGIEDDVLDLDALDEGAREELIGEGALLAALDAHRTGRMGDIVATIQAEQDRIIRSDLPGVLVVQGGPGTGKTAVALHRAAYLLYTHRDRLSRSGALLVGPSEVFLRYIEQVLPSLGESGVVMTTPARLFPGVEAEAADVPAVAALKGDPRIAQVLAAAVAARQRVPAGPQALDVDGTTVVLRPRAVAAARDRARRTRKPHNLARVVFVRDLLGSLADQVIRQLGGRLGEEDRADVVADLRAARDVRVALNLAWMPLTPQKLLADLFADPVRLATAAPNLSREEREMLLRARDAGWTLDDVPLLDEAAELLGEDDSAARAQARRDAALRQEEVAYARESLRMSGAAAMVSAETLVDRFRDDGPAMSTAERAALDRTWAYGHVVVDEAQELSPMMWRLLMRRCPSRSMTVVGDVAQTGAAAGARSWSDALDPYVAGRWRQEELTVNYRTPGQIMDLAAGVLAAAGVTVRAPQSVRAGSFPPVATRLRAGAGAEQGDRLVEVVGAEVGLLGGGRLAVITPRQRLVELRDLLIDRLPAGVVAGGRAGLDAAVAVLSVDQAKGLEFDGVVLLEPAEVLCESPRGVNDLYVALTRPTKRLHVLHTGALPAGMGTLA